MVGRSYLRPPLQLLENFRDREHQNAVPPALPPPATLRKTVLSDIAAILSHRLGRTARLFRLSVDHPTPEHLETAFSRPQKYYAEQADALTKKERQTRKKKTDKDSLVLLVRL